MLKREVLIYQKPNLLWLDYPGPGLIKPLNLDLQGLILESVLAVVGMAPGTGDVRIGGK